MKKIAIVFPGQGSQYVGMGQKFYESYQEIRKLYEEAGDILGYDIKHMCMEGDAEELMLSGYTQPAILTTSVAAFKAFQIETGLLADYFAGHSLGEYSALVCSGALKFSDALMLVRKRGLFMQEAAADNVGMAAINNIDASIIEDMCKEYDQLNISGYNGYDQITVSGRLDLIDDLKTKLNDYGVDVIYLKVKSPFHSSYMEPVMQKMQMELEKINLYDNIVPVLSNIDGQPYKGKESIVQNLTDQIISPVNWLKCMKYMEDHGVGIVIDIGPKATLRNLFKSYCNLIENYSYDNAEDIDVIQESIVVKQDKMRLLTKSLAIAVCTRNQNWNETEYEEGVVVPYQKVKSQVEALEEAGEEPSMEHMQEAIQMLQTMFSTKKTPIEEQKERFHELFNESGTYGLFSNLNLV